MNDKLTTILHEEALNDVSRVDVRTSQFGAHIVELGALSCVSFKNIRQVQKGMRQIRVNFEK